MPSLPGSTRSARLALAAVLPGTVNDATPFPASEKSHGSYHWVFERTLSAALIPALIVPALTGGAAYVGVRGGAGKMGTLTKASSACFAVAAVHRLFLCRIRPALAAPLLARSARPPLQPIADGILCTALIVHSHLGFDQCLIDYVHPRKFPVLGPIGKWALRAATALSVYGVYEFETNDIGESGD